MQWFGRCRQSVRRWKQRWECWHLAPCESSRGEREAGRGDIICESQVGGMTDMAPMGSGMQGQSVSLDSSLPQPLYTRNSGQVSPFCELENSCHARGGWSVWGSIGDMRWH